MNMSFIDHLVKLDIILVRFSPAWMKIILLNVNAWRIVKSLWKESKGIVSEELLLYPDFKQSCQLYTGVFDKSSE